VLLYGLDGVGQGTEMRRNFTLRVAILAAVASVIALFPPSASAASVTYQLTVTESAPTMLYGNPSPSFRAYLTAPSDDPPINANIPFYVAVDSVNYTGSLSGTGPSYVLYVGGVAPPPLAVGQHSVMARYQSPKHGWLTSTPIVLTVLRITPALSCSIGNWANTYPPKTPLTITFSFANTGAPVDVQNGTFTITFAGATTFTDANLVAQGGQVVAPAPSALGVYAISCTFSGTSSFGPTGFSFGNVIVSPANQVGGIALYTNPTPVTNGPMITWKVVVSGRPGLPAPTGDIRVMLAGSTSSPVPLSGGVATFQLVAPYVQPSDIITVWYYGDPVYAASSAKFSLNTSPISNGAPPSAAPAASPPQAAQQSPTPASSPTQSAVESPTQSPSSSASPSASHSLNAVLSNSKSTSIPGGGGALYFVGAAALLMLVGLGSRLAWRRRRRGRA
jgi:hypothetical protein